jgi:hypothetical protein
MTSKTDAQRDALVIPVAVVVSVGWLFSLGIAALTAKYTAITVTTPVMLLLAGYVFGTSIVTRGKSNDA